MTYRSLPQDSVSIFKQLVRKASAGREGPLHSETEENQDDHSEKVKALLISDKSGLPIDALLRLKKIIDVASYVDKSTSDDLAAAHRIWSVMRSTSYIQPLSSKDRWIKALTIVLRSKLPANEDFRSTVNSREGVEGRAFAELRSRGFSIIIDGRGPRLDPKSYILVCREIENLIKRAGGLHVASTIFKVLKADQRFIDAYFSHARRLSHLFEVTQAETPWHFLYTLALKHLHEDSQSDQPSSILQEMEQLSKIFSAACSFQPHSIYENLGVSNSSLEGLIFESVSYDEMVAFPQWQGLVASNLVLDFLECLNERGYIFPRYPIDIWLLFAKILIERAKNDDFSPIHEFDLVSQGLTFVQSSYFMETFTCPQGHLNSAYRLPSDTNNRNHTRYPIIRGHSDITIVQPLSIASRALCERLHDLGNSAKGNLNAIAGKALESLTARILNRAGNQITVAEARYRGEKKGIDYEVDFVVETSEIIYFIECKKKALTTIARTGQTLNIFEDLANSIITTVKQLARHEHFLRLRKQLEFQNGYVPFLGSRRIEKIAISLHDHGSLHERSFLVPFLRKMAVSHLSASSPRASHVLKIFNKELIDFQRYISWIKDENDPDHAFHDFALSTWWFSIDQLAYMLEKTGNLQSGLSLMRNLTSKSGDFVHELFRASSQDPLIKAMREVALQLGAQAII